MQGASRESLRETQEAFDAAVAGTGADRLTRTAGDLFAVVGLLASQPGLRRALSDPSLPGDRKGEVIESLLGSQLTAEALAVVRDAVRRRWAEPGDLTDAVETLAAQAAFTGAEREGRLDEVEDELFRFARIVDSQPQLRAALTDPSLPDARKVELLASLLGSKVAPTTLQVIDYVVTEPRGRTFERAVAQFVRLAAARRERLVARVTSAVALDAAQQERLGAGLARVYGRQVQLELEVDPQLVGGVVVTIGDEVIDGSIASRLKDARRRLAG